MLRLSLHGLSIAPFIYVVVLAFTSKLGADPQEQLLNYFGLWNLYFLILTLAATPLAKIFKWRVVLSYRRMLGLYFYFYLVMHFLVYGTFFLNWQWSLVITEIIKRPYITVGFVALVLATLLAITSNQYSQRKLKKNWKRLHYLTYPIAILGCIHFIWQTKSDLNEPLLYMFIVVGLLSYRFWTKFSLNERLFVLLMYKKQSK